MNLNKNISSFQFKIKFVQNLISLADESAIFAESQAILASLKLNFIEKSADSPPANFHMLSNGIRYLIFLLLFISIFLMIENNPFSQSTLWRLLSICYTFFFNIAIRKLLKFALKNHLT